jgi:hypothetical protein
MTEKPEEYICNAPEIKGAQGFNRTTYHRVLSLPKHVKDDRIVTVGINIKTNVAECSWIGTRADFEKYFRLVQ